MKKEKIPQNVLHAAEGLVDSYGMKIVPKEENSEQPSQRYIGVKPASFYSSLSRWTLSRAVKAGELSCIKIGKGQTGKILFDRKELDRFISNHVISCKANKQGE